MKKLSRLQARPNVGPVRPRNPPLGDPQLLPLSPLATLDHLGWRYTAGTVSGPDASAPVRVTAMKMGATTTVDNAGRDHDGQRMQRTVGDARLNSHRSTSDSVEFLTIDNYCYYLLSIDRDRSTLYESREILPILSARHGSRSPLAYVFRTGNQGLAKRLGAAPNRPVWSRAAVEAPKLVRSRVGHTSRISRSQYVRCGYFGPVTPYFWSASQPPMLQPSKRPNGATFGCLDGWSHWWRRSHAAAVDGTPATCVAPPAGASPPPPPPGPPPPPPPPASGWSVV